MANQIDWLGERRADELAAQIVKYWADRGYTVEAWAEQSGKSSKRRLEWGVRSNMIGGGPKNVWV